MKNNHYKIPLLIFSFQSMLFSPLYSQIGDIKFEHITTEQGLSSNTVYDILQDHRGFMWFATRDGLNRFDGHHIKEYKHSSLDTNSISVNWCGALHEDRYSKLWIGTLYGGLNVFDPVTEKFMAFKHDPENPHSISNDVVLAISEDDSGNFWIGTWHGLNFLRRNYVEYPDPQTVQFVHYNHDPNNSNSISDDRIWTICIDRDGIIWIGTDTGGLNRFDLKTEFFKHYRYEPNNPRSLRHNSVRCIYEDPALKRRTLWIGTLLGGLHKFDVTDEIFESENFVLPESFAWGSHTVMSVLRDKNGDLWSGTWNGLKRYVSENRELIPHEFLAYKKDNSSLGNDEIRCIYEDCTSILWLGTTGGVKKVYTKKSNFHNHKNLYGICLYEDQFGVLWTAGSAGLCRIDRHEQSIINYSHRSDDTTSISSNEVYAIAEETDAIDQTLWLLCRDGGLDQLILTRDPHSGRKVSKIHHILPIRSDSISDACKYGLTLVRDRNGMLWIGTNEGLFQFDPKSSIVAPYQSDPADPKTRIKDRVDRIYQSPFDKGNILWLGTINGLYYVDLDRNKVTHYQPDPNNSNSLSDNRVISLVADAPSQGRILWIGTFSGGLNRFDIEKGTFSHLAQSEGLPSNTIYSILQEDRGQLWLGTDNGLAKFNPKNQVINTYAGEDNLQVTAFYPGGAFKSTRTGELFFGGDGGYISFYPDSISDNSHIPPIAFTDFRVDNKAIKLDTSITSIRKIKLSYQQNFFSFQFASLDYANPKKNQYAYMLRGLDRDWVYAGNRNIAYYTDVKPGKYIFRVKGSNNDGVWNENGASVQIIITPPFWKTSWFQILSILIIFGTLFLFYYRHVSRLKREKHAQQDFSKRLIEAGEIERKRIAGELHDSLGQSLLITKNEIEQCLRLHAVPEASAENLKEISVIVSESIDEVREIAYDLHPHQLDRLGLTKAIESIIARVIKSSTVVFFQKIDKIDDLFPKEMEIHIFRIVQEAFNNIIKHANASNARLEIHQSDPCITIVIQDDGRGFHYKQVLTDHADSKGLGLTDIAERVRILGGELTIHSAPNQGTSVKIKIPITEPGYDK